jgi:hypothetical protein
MRAVGGSGMLVVNCRSALSAWVPWTTLRYAEKVRSQVLSLRHIILKYKVNCCFSIVDARIASGSARVWKASVILSEIRSRAELHCALPLFLHPSHQRNTAHRPIGIGRPRTRRRFGHWGAQIGHLRDQSGHHFGTRRQNSKTLSLPVARRRIARTTPRSGVRVLPRYQRSDVRQTTIFCGRVRLMAAPKPRARVPCHEQSSPDAW